jgi:hypothetical protein
MARAVSPSKRRSADKHTVVGDLRANPHALAIDIQAALLDGDHLVWADEHHTVFVSRGKPPQVPDHWIVGNYMMGAPSEGIAQDLFEIWHERSKNFIID